MDLADADTATAALPDVKILLERAKCLNDAIDAPGASNDEWFQRFASDTQYSAQLPRGTTTTTASKTPPFPQLLAAFDATVEHVATPAQKKMMMKEPRSGYNYNLTHFVGAMSQQQRRALKLALHADVELIIATARRNATDAEPKLFDGVVLASSSNSTADARTALDALNEEAQEQLHTLKRRIAALAHAD